MKKLVLALCFALAAGLSAQEGDLKKAAKQAKAAVVESGKAVAAAGKEAAADVKEAVDKAVDKVSATVSGEAVAQIDPKDLIRRHARANLHNKVVHFPVALGLLGVAFLLAALRWPSALVTGRWMIFFAGLGAIAAYFTGGPQESEFEGTSLALAVETHERAGIFVLGLLWISFVLSYMPSTKKWSWLVYVFLAVVIVMAAAMGGAIAHHS